MSSISFRVRQLFATLAQMTSTNPVLLEGEQWTEKDATTGHSTGRRKVGNGTTAFNSLPFEPNTLSSPTAHAASHGTGGADAITVAQSQVTGLATALGGKETAGAAAAAVAAHEAAVDPHPGYLTSAELPTIPAPADAAPAALAAAAAIGTSADYAREDHVHQRDSDLLVVNLSGSQSDPTAANGIETFTFQWPAQILASALSADTAASGSAFQVNARLNASSIYSVRPQIAVGNTTGSSGTLAITTAAAGDVLRFDILQAGGGCRLAKLYLTVRRNNA